MEQRPPRVPVAALHRAEAAVSPSSGPARRTPVHLPLEVRAAMLLGAALYQLYHCEKKGIRSLLVPDSSDRAMPRIERALIRKPEEDVTNRFHQSKGVTTG